MYNLKKGLPSALPDAEAEYDDPETIHAIRDAIEEAGFTTELFEATEDLPLRLAEGKLDIVFNIAEGVAGRGREAHVPALLSFLGIPYTGSDETTLCIAMDKALTKRIAATYGVRTPHYRLHKIGGLFSDEGLQYPVIAKPNTEGSSKGLTGLSIADNASALQMLVEETGELYGQDMLLEEYIAGREFTVGILGNGDDLLLFPPMEILFKEPENSIYSYEVKQHFEQHVSYACPPYLDPGIQEEMRQAAETVYRMLSCRDFARVDFRLSPAGEAYFIEITPLPGLAPGYSDLPMMAAFCGMSYTALVQKVLFSALDRYGLSSPQEVAEDE